MSLPLWIVLVNVGLIGFILGAATALAFALWYGGNMGRPRG
jgi:hypothetical protein